jgi:aspartyl-tRNA(Asn)/glutamyl-tRNA(Gln) amidotransferase subunit C
VVDRDVVRRVAALARLRLTEEQETLFVAQLGDIIEYVDVLERLPDGDRERATLVSAPLRIDEAVNPDRAESLLAGAPDRDGDRLRVPAVMDEIPE